MNIEKYNIDKKDIWNEFVANSKQGTFMLNRNFMDYHSDRFFDNSLMFYNDKQKLIAILPANIKDNVLYSHQGLSYGGLIYGNDAKTVDILECFDVLKQYCKESGIKKVIYKKIPYIYNKYPADEDLYALFRNDAILNRKDIGYAIDILNKIKLIQARRTELNKAIKQELVVNVVDNYNDYYNILSDVLQFSHNTKPTHSLAEMQLLADNFKDNIKLVCSFDKNGIMLSGVWLFIEQNVVHTQYIATSQEGKKCGAFEIIVDFLLKEYADKKYLSFGISTEQNGRYLNEGLAFQKESFGGRGVCYDFYEINI
jgi:hypothetical protein